VPIGYLGDPVNSAATFVETGGRRWSLPGDLAIVEADGTIRVLGRGSLSINTGGEKVFPEEVEAVVKAHSSVVDALVVGLPDDRFGQQVCAVVALMPGCRLDLDQLRDFCRAHLSGYKIPRRLVVVDDVRRSAAGKPDYLWAIEFARSTVPDGGAAMP
jgi:fatty-acyl-CoA synthase